jgi:putative ABC transport system permease protein
MIRNFFIVAIRNLRRNKIFSTINILGLAIGMASALLIGLWILDELGYDRFHVKEDRLYMAYRSEKDEGVINAINFTPKVLAPKLKSDYPEIEDVARWQQTNFLFTVANRHFNLPGNFTDSAFLRMFSFSMLEGNPHTALNGPNDIVITASLARKLFGNESAIGKQVKVDSVDFFIVKGVLKDLPDNTQFKFEYLLPWSYLKKIGWDDDYWQNNSVRTFYTLKPGISGTSFDTKIKNLLIQHTRQDKVQSTSELFGHPASKWHLYSKFENGKIAGGQIDSVRMFIIIAGFILLIACINFMNLSTARSEKRVKEVGIRKVVGAPRSFLVWQFLAESLIFSFISGLLAVLIVGLSLPAFNLLVSKKLFIDFYNVSFWITGCGFIFLTGLLAGSYPAFYLSSFKPIKVFKGVFNAGKEGASPRKFLVVVQFTFAIILIISTFIVMQQIRYAQNRDAGYQKDNLVYNYMQGDIDKNFPMIRNELLSSGVAVSVTRTTGPMTRHWADTWGFEWPGSTEADRKIDFNFFGTDELFVHTMGLNLIAGRDINASNYLTDSSAMLLNQSAVKIMRLDDPIGKPIQLNGSSWHVVGVIKDFILESPYASVSPMMIHGPDAYGFYILNMKLNPSNTVSDNLKKAETIFKKYNPQYPFEYNFVDEEYASKFANEKRTGKLAGLFAGLTIFISCLGLFGLASFMAENRIKEIGIRKVLGASVVSITRLLSKDFLRLVMLSFLIASPFAWWVMNKWLQSYSYRIHINWWIFALVFFLCVTIALVTVSFQSVKAAMANPAKSLRSE